MSPDVAPPPRPFPEVLQERLVCFAAAVCDQARQVRRDLVTSSMVEQVLRSATSVAANYAEARAAQPRRDFIHKMQICLKELRETQVWLELVCRTTQIRKSEQAIPPASVSSTGAGEVNNDNFDC